jgi:hypothetical protein
VLPPGDGQTVGSKAKPEPGLVRDVPSGPVFPPGAGQTVRSEVEPEPDTAPVLHGAISAGQSGSRQDQVFAGKAKKKQNKRSRGKRYASCSLWRLAVKVWQGNSRAETWAFL